MDLLPTNSTTNSPLTPVFGDNVQDLLGTGTLHLNPSAIITVNSIADGVNDLESGVTTLRDAINRANADDGEDLIVFARSLFTTAQTITLNLGELDITHSLDIMAPRDSLTGGDLVTVSGNNATRVFEIEAGATVNFSGLIVADGSVTGVDGGGILNSGTLTLDSSIVRNNYATATVDYQSSGGNGGGIKNSGILTLDSSVIRDNSGRALTSGNNFSGGGIYSTGTVRVNNSTISGNSTGFLGGGIYGVSLTVTNSTISGNKAADGGGIFNAGTSTVQNSTISGNKALSSGGGIDNSGTSTVQNSTLSGNSASEGGGIFSSRTSTVQNSTISGNSATLYGGGIFIFGGNLSVGTSTVQNSTISSNSAGGFVGGGGGIYNMGISTVQNSTLSGNSARDSGGGIYNRGTSTVQNSTISSNSATNGGGIYNTNFNTNLSGGTSTVQNSTISSNSATNGGGIYNTYTDAVVTVLFSTITQNQAANGGGVYQVEVPPFSSARRGSFNVRNTIIASNLNTENGVNPDVSGTFISDGYNLIGDGTGSTGFGEATWDIVGTSDWVIDPRLAPLAFNGGSTQTIALLPDSPAIDAGDPTVLDTDPITDQRGLDRVINGRADIGAFEFSQV